MAPPSGTPSDWVSGERVFAPPRGTVDVDWLVPAVLELVPGTSPSKARAALEEAWRRRRADAPADGAPPAELAAVDRTAPDHTLAAADGITSDPALAAADAMTLVPALAANESPSAPELAAAADAVLAEALATFGD